MALTDDLVSYWLLDEASGSALDAHGSNDLPNNGNDPGSVAGKVGNARDYQTFFGHVVASNSDLQTGDIDFTFQGWIKLDSKTADRHIVAKFGGTSLEYQLYYNSGADRFEFLIRNAADNANVTVTASTFGSPSTGTWYLLHAWHDATNNQLGIAVNAGTADTTSHSGGVNTGAESFRISGHGFGLPGDHQLDEVGLWKRVLTSEERTQLYNGGDGLAYADFVGGGGTTHTLDLNGSLPVSAAFAKADSKPLAATTTPTAALAKAVTPGAKAGTVTPTGALSRRPGKSLSGASPPSGSMAKAATKPRAGALPLSGSLSAVKVALLALSGTLSLAGSLARSAGKGLAATLTPSAALARAAARALAATLSGSLARAAGKGVAGAASLAGALARAAGRLLAGALSLAGLLTREGGSEDVPTPRTIRLQGRADAPALRGRADTTIRLRGRV